MGRMMFRDRENSVEERLNKYLFNFESQEKPGLLVVKSGRLLEMLRGTLDRNEIRESCTWWALLNNLNSCENTFMVLNSEFSTEVYDIIQQYEARRGTIQVVDQQTREIQTASCNPKQTRLLLVTTQSDLDRIEKVYPLRERVGLTEIL